MPPDFSESNRPNESIDLTIKRLQSQIADGDEHLRSDLAEALLRAAQEAALIEKFDISIKRIDEALKIIRQLVDEGQSELSVFVGRALLFRAAVARFHDGPQAGVNAFNEAIRHIAESGSDTDAMTQNELAMALMSKADILMDPLGAFAAASAAQEQAVKIWQHLVNQGNLEFRQALISSLMSCSDSKIQNGDPASAIRDLQRAVEIAEDGVEAGETLIQPYYVQALLKLARLYDAENNLEKAFETVRSAIRTIKKLIADGIEQAKMMFTTLYLHLGMLYEQVNDSTSALAEFDRCRDVYMEIFREKDWGASESYAFRTGLANVLMCRGNMLADLKRYEESEQAFEDSVWQYKEAAKIRPKDDDDATMIPYSIGVVQLNHANLLVLQNRFKEAITLKKKALKALKRRMEAGHHEILPNYLAAHQKLISIRKEQGKTKQVLALLDEVIGVLEQYIDEGNLEFHIDLAMTYRQRSIIRDELNYAQHALDDSKKALRLFRTIADDDRDISDVHVAKVQWSEVLHQIAVIILKTGKNDQAFDFLKKEIAELLRFYTEGNECVAADLVLGYSQYFDFVETFSGYLNDLGYSEKKFVQRVKQVQKHCKHGIELSLQQQERVSKNLIAKLFFMMKTAFFHKADGVLHKILKNNEAACKAFDASIERWYILLGGLENLKAKDRYDAAEKRQIPEWGKIETPESEKKPETEEPYQDRYLFYISELRETMQLAAKAQLACGRNETAAELYEKENALTREIAGKGIPNTDRYLIVSLTSHARSFKDIYPVEKTKQLFEEALSILFKRFASGEVVTEDFWVLKRIVRHYIEYLSEKKLSDDVERIGGCVIAVLESVQTFPPPSMWLSFLMTLDLFHNVKQSPDSNVAVLTLYRQLLKRHPEYDTDKEMKGYDSMLHNRIFSDKPNNGQMEEDGQTK